MQQDNFQNRYFIKVGSSVLIAIFNMVIQLLLPRALSVEEYGYYTYNLSVFTSIVIMANLSTSSALVSKFSKRNDEIGIVYFYLKIFFLLAFILNLLVIVLFPIQLLQSTFVGQTIGIVLLGMETAILNKLFTDCISIFDASAISRFPAVMQIVAKVILSFLMFSSYMFGKFSLLAFYIIQVCVTGVIVSVMLVIVIKDQKRRYPMQKDFGIRHYVGEYYHFCKPLIFATLISQLVVIVMNWLLMNGAGAKEQAMFGAAWQLNTLVGYVFSPYAELLKREFAIIHDRVQELRRIYEKSLKLMIWITSYFSMFIGFCSGWILPIIYGKKYMDAAMVTLLVMLYTVYQGWGQVNGSFMMATERTRMNAALSIINQILMMIAAFVFQVPNALFPSGLGALGIAFAYLVPVCLSVLLSTSCIAHVLDLSKAKTWRIHVLPLSLCAALAMTLYFVINALWLENTMVVNVIKILVSGVIYTTIVGAIVFIKPEYIGVSKKFKNSRK